MRVIARSTLRAFWEREPAARSVLEAWFAEARNASWKTSADVKATYRSASILKGGRVVFNICGNSYRLVVAINYAYSLVYIRFVGTHRQYDAIDAETI
ncbi:MAG: type II toxin-antitoxin system HigB family toxin [Candidatus Hydrogenedentales bacterium]|jgi:mRNA interferase HigB